MSILELDRPFLAANRVNFEDAEWWTAEDMVKRWILATKLVGKALAVMQTQLMAQECGAFDRFKDDYFMAIAKQSILVLLKFADGFTSTRSPEKLIYVLELHGALGSSAPGLLPLFSGKHGELISRQVPVVLAKLERNLEEKPVLACAGGSPSRHLFLANNTSFVPSRAADAGVASLLGGEWAERRRDRLEQHAASYLEASWAPVVACLAAAAGGGGGKPARALAKFSAAFEKARGSQAGREVPDPALRAALREAVSEMVVPAYGAFLEKHPKLGKSVRYTAADVAQSLSELFEGDAGIAENRSASCT